MHGILLSGSGVRPGQTGGRAGRAKSAALAQLVPGLLAGRSWPDKATEHLPDFNRACARCHDRIVGGEGPQLLFIVSFHGAKTQEPLASSTGPKITIWPDSTQGRQCSAWRAMISRSSSLMSSANVGRVAVSRKTNVLMSQECQVPDHGRVPRQFVAGGSTGRGRARTRRWAAPAGFYTCVEIG